MNSQRGRIAARAYELWKLRGRPEGSPDVDWHQAENELVGADDPSKPKTTLDSLQQAVADVLAPGSDRGPTDSDTEDTFPDGPSSKPARRRRNSGWRKRENGASRD